MGQGASAQSIGLRAWSLNSSPVFDGLDPRCGWDITQTLIHDEIFGVFDNISLSSEQRSSNTSLPSFIVIPMHMHMIYTEQAVVKRPHTIKDIRREVDNINTAYRPHGIQFHLKNHTKRIAPRWAALTVFQAVQGALSHCFKDVYQGGLETLNVFYLSDAWYYNGYTNGPTGITILPFQTAEKHQNTYYHQGPMVWGDLLGGYDSVGAYRGFSDNSFISIHEIGHWLGLKHTFNDACTSDNLYDFGTPPASMPSDFDEKIKEHGQCPHVIGCDGIVTEIPADNYMDYMPQHCPAGFTVEQRCWMRLTYWAQRQGRAPFSTIQEQKEAVRAGRLLPC